MEPKEKKPWEQIPTLKEMMGSKEQREQEYEESIQRKAEEEYEPWEWDLGG